MKAIPIDYIYQTNKGGSLPDPSSRSLPSRLISWIAERPVFGLGVLIALVSFVVYANALKNGFVFDDMALIAENDAIKDFRFLPEIFVGNLWGFLGRASNYYRPIPPLIFMITYQLAGLTPWVYHLVNILLHAGTSVIVFLIMLNILDRSFYRESSSMRWASFACSLVFVTHPVHTEAVTWIAGIMDLGCTFFSLFSFYLYLVSDRSRLMTVPYIFSLVFFFLATLTKEPALTLPAIIITADYILTDPERRSFLASGKRTIPFIGVMIVYLLIRANALKGFSPIPPGESSLTFSNAMLNVLYLFSIYLKGLFLPTHLTVLHDIPPLTSWFGWKAIISILVVLAFAMVCVITARHYPAMFLGFVFLAFPLAPALYLPALVQALRHALADRYIYFGSFGFVLICAAILTWLGSRSRRWFKAGLTVTLVIAAVFAVLTVERNTVWKDNFTLWKDAVQKAPESSIAQKHFGFALLKRGQSEEGKNHLGIALALDPGIPDAEMALGMQYVSKGLINKAILAFATVLLFAPDSVEANYNLGLAYQSRSWNREAIQQYEKTLLLRRDYPDAHVNLGIAYAETGRIDSAIEHLREAVRLRPDDMESRNNLEKALKLK